MSAVKDSTFSTITGEALKLSPPTLPNLEWIPDSVEVMSDGDWNEERQCGTANYSFENGKIVLSGDVRIAAGAAFPAKGGYVTDGDTKHWRVIDSKITELFNCKPCKGSLTIEWTEEFQAIITAGDFTVNGMTAPPFSGAFQDEPA